MKKNTRQLILNTAKRLFNEHGYNSVSLKDIADELNISKGNLTYHFRKKEDIMESLVLETKQKKRHSKASSLEELDAIFTDMQKTLQEHAYYFLHHAQLSTLSSKIKDVQNYAYRETVNIFRQSFHALNAEGLLRDEMFDSEYEHVIHTLMLSCIYWTPFVQLQKTIGEECDFRTQAWASIHHLLTEKGRIQLSEMIKL